MIPRNRLKYIPKDLRFNHKYCYYLHDQCLKLLRDMQKAEGDLVKIPYEEEELKVFEEIANESNTINALRNTSKHEEAKRVILNAVIIKMTEDALHYIFESLKCLEKRKTSVAMTLLRKPLTDHQMYLTWVLTYERAFYKAFTEAPTELEKRAIKARENNIAEAIKRTDLEKLHSMKFDDYAKWLNDMLYNKECKDGFQLLFQHSVHLITTHNINISTSPENFNFIFKNPFDDDIYHHVYDRLPYILLYLSRVIFELFNKMERLSSEFQDFKQESVWGLYLLKDAEKKYTNSVCKSFSAKIDCSKCQKRLKVTKYNAQLILFQRVLRCTY